MSRRMTGMSPARRRALQKAVAAAVGVLLFGLVLGVIGLVIGANNPSRDARESIAAAAMTAQVKRDAQDLATVEALRAERVRELRATYQEIGNELWIGSQYASADVLPVNPTKRELSNFATASDEVNDAQGVCVDQAAWYNHVAATLPPGLLRAAGLPVHLGNPVCSDFPPSTKFTPGLEQKLPAP
jgi:hypothetical protein